MLKSVCGVSLSVFRAREGRRTGDDGAEPFDALPREKNVETAIGEAISSGGAGE